MKIRRYLVILGIALLAQGALATQAQSDTLTWGFDASVSVDGESGGCSTTFTVPSAGGSATFPCDIATVTATVNISALTFSLSGFGNFNFPGGSCTGTGGGSSAITVTSTAFTTSGALSGGGTCTDEFGSFPFTVSGSYNASAASLGKLSVSPTSGLIASGPEGGPFSPFSMGYTLKNTGGKTISFSVSKTQNWVSLTKTSGSLAPGASTPVGVAINPNANNLPQGSHSDTVSFTNTTNNQGNTSRSVSLTVNAPEVITLEVPPFKQDTDELKKATYDKVKFSIAEKGCALTSAVMLLRYYGITTGPDGKPVNPRNLNDWLNDQSIPLRSEFFGYSEDGGIYFPALARFARDSGHNVGYKRRDLKPGENLGQLDQIVDQALASGNPVILEVKSPLTGRQHFVIVTGKTIVNGVATYTINDPFYDRKTMLDPSDGKPAYKTYKSVRRFPRKDVSSGAFVLAQDSGVLSSFAVTNAAPATPAIDSFGVLVIAVTGNVDTLVTDPLGKRMGIHPATGADVLEIPDAGFGLDFIGNDAPELGGVEQTPHETHVYEVTSPVEGTYVIDIRSDIASDFSLTMFSYDIEGNLNAIKVVEGIVPAGKVVRHKFVYSFRPRINPMPWLLLLLDD